MKWYVGEICDCWNPGSLRKWRIWQRHLENGDGTQNLEKPARSHPANSWGKVMRATHTGNEGTTGMRWPTFRELPFFHIWSSRVNAEPRKGGASLVLATHRGKKAVPRANSSNQHTSYVTQLDCPTHTQASLLQIALIMPLAPPPPSHFQTYCPRRGLTPKLQMHTS